MRVEFEPSKESWEEASDNLSHVSCPNKSLKFQQNLCGVGASTIDRGHVRYSTALKSSLSEIPLCATFRKPNLVAGRRALVSGGSGAKRRRFRRPREVSPDAHCEEGALAARHTCGWEAKKHPRLR
jgi:hypothetical protein